MAIFKTTFGDELNIPLKNEQQYVDTMPLELVVNTNGITTFSLANFDKFAKAANVSVSLLGFVTPDPSWNTPLSIVPMNMLTTVKMTAEITKTDANINVVKVTSTKTNSMETNTPLTMRIKMMLSNALH